MQNGQEVPREHQWIIGCHWNVIFRSLGPPENMGISPVFMAALHGLSAAVLPSQHITNRQIMAHTTNKRLLSSIFQSLLSALDFMQRSPCLLPSQCPRAAALIAVRSRWLWSPFVRSLDCCTSFSLFVSFGKYNQLCPTAATLSP